MASTTRTRVTILVRRLPHALWIWRACVCVCMWWSDFSYSVAPYHSWLLLRPFAKVHWTSIVALYSIAQVAHNKLFTSFTLCSRIRISETCWQLLDWIWNSFAISVAHIYNRVKTNCDPYKVNSCWQNNRKSKNETRCIVFSKTEKTDFLWLFFLEVRCARNRHTTAALALLSCNHTNSLNCQRITGGKKCPTETGRAISTHSSHIHTLTLRLLCSQFSFQFFYFFGAHTTVLYKG